MSKILFLTPNLSSGGAEKQLMTIAKLLKEKGMDVEIVCYTKGDFYVHLFKEDNIPIHWHIFNNYLLRLVGIRKLIRKGNFSAVISFLNTPNFLNNFAAIGGKKWKVITGERSSDEKKFSTLRGKVFGWFQRYSDFIVCNSHNANKIWLTYYPQYKKKLTTIYNAVELLKITNNYIPKRDRKTHIIIAASYSYVKNPIGVVKALSLLNDEEKCKIKVDWYGRKEVTIGNTRAYDKTKTLISNYSLQHILSLHEESRDIYNIMNQADFIALFSRYEGMPNIICEGMMLGKPIIMTRVSDHNKLVDETNGLLCDWDDIYSIRDTFISAISLDENSIREMGINSKIKADMLFSREQISKQWADLIKM
jgi:glycosyltransferase involved in cell wall biosynthesis